MRAFSAVSLFLIDVRREHLADTSNAAPRERAASTQVDRAPSIRRAHRWVVPAVRAVREDVLALEHVLGLADLRVQASAVLVQAVPAQRRLRLRQGARSARRHAAVHVAGSSIRRPKKVR